MTPASRETPRSRAAAAALAALHLPGAQDAGPGESAVPARAWYAGALVETVPGAGPRVAARLLVSTKIQLCGGDGDQRLAVVLGGRGPPEAARAALLRADPEIVAIRLLRLFEEPRENP